MSYVIRDNTVRSLRQPVQDQLNWAPDGLEDAPDGDEARASTAEPPLASILHDYEEAKAHIAGLARSESTAEPESMERDMDEPLPETEAIDLRTVPPVPGPGWSRELATESTAYEPDAPAEHADAEPLEESHPWRRWALRLRRHRPAA